MASHTNIFIRVVLGSISFDYQTFKLDEQVTKHTNFGVFHIFI